VPASPTVAVTRAPVRSRCRTPPCRSSCRCRSGPRRGSAPSSEQERPRPSRIQVTAGADAVHRPRLSGVRRNPLHPLGSGGRRTEVAVGAGRALRSAQASDGRGRPPTLEVAEIGECGRCVSPTLLAVGADYECIGVPIELLTRRRQRRGNVRTAGTTTPSPGPSLACRRATVPRTWGAAARRATEIPALNQPVHLARRRGPLSNVG
jgi:hypothetical protein